MHTTLSVSTRFSPCSFNFCIPTSDCSEANLNFSLFFRLSRKSTRKLQVLHSPSKRTMVFASWSLFTSSFRLKAKANEAPGLRSDTGQSADYKFMIPTMPETYNTKTSPLRLNALADGVFAIAMTLLVLELRVPEVTGRITADRFIEILNDITPSLTSFLITFFVIGIYWSIHNRMAKFIVEIDRHITRYSFFLLLGVSILPFTTQIQGRFGYLGLATSLYALNVVICGLSLYRMWSYCVANREHLHPEVPGQMLTDFKYRLMVAPAVFSLSIPLAFVNPSLARYFWLFCLLSTPLSRGIQSVFQAKP